MADKTNNPENEASTSRTPDVKVRKVYLNDPLLGEVIKEWDPIDLSAPYTLIPLSKSSLEYQRVEHRFFISLEPNEYTTFQIEKILRVQNPLLMLRYLRKKKAKLETYGHVTEHILFHGAHKDDMETICEENFKMSSGLGYTIRKYGNGTYFFTKTEVACEHPLFKPDTMPRLVFLAKVLEVDRCIGAECSDTPKGRYDVTTSINGDVLVKYANEEYYPLYAIFYTKQLIKTEILGPDEIHIKIEKDDEDEPAQLDSNSSFGGTND